MAIGFGQVLTRLQLHCYLQRRFSCSSLLLIVVASSPDFLSLLVSFLVGLHGSHFRLHSCFVHRQLSVIMIMSSIPCLIWEFFHLHLLPSSLISYLLR